MGEQSLDNATCDQVTKLLMDSPPLLQLTVYRRPSDRDSKSRSEFIEWSLNLMYMKCRLVKLFVLPVFNRKLIRFCFLCGYWSMNIVNTN